MKLDLRHKTHKALFVMLFFLYLLFLIKVILLKYGFTMSLLLMQLPERSYNIIPFKTIISYCLKSDFKTCVFELLGNIIAFIPMGFLLPFLLKRINKMRKIVAICLMISLSFELIQLLTNVGQFDIDDIILNTLGSVIGFLIYKGLNFRIVKTWSNPGS